MSKTQIPAELEKQLMTIGLTNYQARVYRAVYILNECSISQIENYSKVPAAKIYTVIRQLKDMGLIGEILKTRPAMFKAYPPDKFIEQEKNKIVEIGNRIKESLKDLEEFRKEQKPVEEYETISIGNELLVKNLILDALNPLPKEVIVLVQDDLEFYEDFLVRLDREAKSNAKTKVSVLLIDPYERQLEQFLKLPSINIQIIPHHNISPALIESLKSLPLLFVLDENCFINIIKTKQNIEYLYIKSRNFSEFLKICLKNFIKISEGS